MFDFLKIRKILEFFVIESLDQDSLKNLDPDPDSMNLDPQQWFTYMTLSAVISSNLTVYVTRTPSME